LPPTLLWRAITEPMQTQDTDLWDILPKNRTEPENAVSGFLHFQCLSGTENGRAS